MPDRSQCVPQPLGLGSSSRGHSLKQFPTPHVNLGSHSSRFLQSGNETCSGATCCDIGWYQSEDLTREERLWPIWKVAAGKSALDADVLESICEAELQTTNELERLGMCFGCGDGKCLPPFSLVLFARLRVSDFTGTMSCSELASEFSKQRGTVEAQFATCVSDIKTSGFKIAEDQLPESCPVGFSPVMVDSDFGPDNLRVAYTSSIFPSLDGYDSTLTMYQNADNFGKGTKATASGAYDTQYEAFVNFLVDDSIINDMILAMGSAGVTSVAILVHTRSPWLTCIGLAQIILSFPLAFFVYTFVGRLDFFPFLNFIGVFVVFALGADDVFVAVDKWKNARNGLPNGSTEDVAAIAFPDAAGAMFLTTLTTAVAFFGTAVCPVTPLKAFAVFCGLLIVFDYIMCVVLVFPALCLYDRWQIGGRNVCVSCQRGVAYTEDTEVDERAGDIEEKPSLIRRILLFIYKYLHMARWALLVVVLVAFGFTAYRASKLALPNSSDVRLLSSSYEEEQSYEWRLNLLYDTLIKAGGSRGFVVWGLKAADTGNQNDPNTWTQLVLDEKFDPSSMEAQTHLRDFCDNLFALDEADPIEPGYLCPINEFDVWLGEQSNKPTSAGYLANCNGASSLPLAQEDFHACIGAYQAEQWEGAILVRNGEVAIMRIAFQTRVRYDSPYDDLNSDWNALEDFMEEHRQGPAGLSGAYHTSEDFWWYDTNGQMLSTAYSAASIALAAAAVVVLFSTRSIVLTIFSLLTIGFVLTSTTTMLIASGWTLGFLESVCFAILIGISCDFVIHFGHAYSHMPGDVSRHDRTKHALITMGPSILAAAFTTICAAVIMIFTVISFFQKFAFILFYSIINATAASFIMFNVFTDCVGPSQPTRFIDKLLLKLCKREGAPEEEEESRAEPVAMKQTEQDESSSEDESDESVALWA